jgi:hypothetical protein
MTRAARFTQADLIRAIDAARKAGLLVGGAKIEPDGTIVVLAAPPGGIPANDRNPLDRVFSR